MSCPFLHFFFVPMSVYHLSAVVSLWFYWKRMWILPEKGGPLSSEKLKTAKSQIHISGNKKSSQLFLATVQIFSAFLYTVKPSIKKLQLMKIVVSNTDSIISITEGKTPAYWIAAGQCICCCLHSALGIASAG